MSRRHDYRDDDDRPYRQRPAGGGGGGSFFGRHPVLSVFGILAGLTILSCMGCCGINLFTGTRDVAAEKERQAQAARIAAEKAREEAKFRAVVEARLAAADGQWAAGKKKEATDEYRAVLNLDLKDLPNRKQQAVIQARFVERQLAEGDKAAATATATKALDAGLDLVPDDDAAKKFVLAMIAQRHEAAEEARRKKAADDAIAKHNREEEARQRKKEADEARAKREADAEKKAEEEYERGGLVLMRKTLSATGGLGGKVSGLIVNRTGRDLGYVQVSFDLYDANKNKVGSALANVAGLKKGESWKFEATTFGREFDTYRIGEMFGR